MGELYGKTLEREWEDLDVRALSDRDYRIWNYLKSNRHRAVCGVYYLPIVTAAYELGKRQEDIEQALFDTLRGLVVYDPRTQEVWVRELAAVNLDTPPDQQPAADPTKRDKRLKAVKKSAESIRSAWLRDQFLAHYAAWDLGLAPKGLTLVKGSEGAPEGLPKPLPTPPGGVPKPIAVAGSSEQVAGSSSNAGDSTNHPAEPSGFHNATAGRLMPLLRQHFYVPDGVPPADYDDGRDFGILVECLRKRITEAELAAAIEGLALMRDAGELDWAQPRSKLTMRALYQTRHGVLDTLTAGEQYFYRHQNQQRGPSAISTILAGMKR